MGDPRAIPAGMAPFLTRPEPLRQEARTQTSRVGGVDSGASTWPKDLRWSWAANSQGLGNPGDVGETANPLRPNLEDCN